MKTTKTALLSFAAALLAVSPGVAVALDAEGISTIYGEGVDSCVTFLNDEKEELQSQHNYDIVWVQGFMSAAGVYLDTQKGFGDITDIDGIMYLIRAHCEENPLDNLETAAIDVAKQLLEKAGRR